MPRSAKFSLKPIGIRNETGLTLLEVIASLVLITFLIGVLAEFLGNGITLWGKSDRAYRRQHEAETIYLTVYQDVSSAFAGKFLPENTIKGDEYQLTFWRETSRGLEQIGYVFDRSKKQIIRSTGFGGGSAEEKVLFEDISDWKFEYYEADSKNWLLEWDPTDPAMIPSLIRMTVSSRGQALGQWVIPLKSWHPDNDNDNTN